MSTQPLNSPQDVLSFWFEETKPQQHFTKDPDFDALVTAKLHLLYSQAVSGALDAWLEAPQSALALVILLDQAPRNMFRDTPQAFASDAQAVMVADKAIAKSFDRDVGDARSSFFYLPFEHAEDLDRQRQALDLFKARQQRLDGNDQDAYQWAVKHERIIARFGRFPHRNAILGRDSTAEELEFLTQPDSSF